VRIYDAGLKRAACGSLKVQDAKNRHLGTIAQLCQAISLQLRHVSTIRKKLLNSNVSPTCPNNMVNFGPVAAEIFSLVWGTPANFNRFRVLAALLHGTLVVGVSQTLWRWTEGATYIRKGGHHVGHWPTFLVLIMAAVWNRAGHYIFALWFLSFSFFFSLPNLSGRRLDVYHNSTHGVALVQI